MFPFARTSQLAGSSPGSAEHRHAAQTRAPTGERALAFALLLALVLSVFEGPVRYALNFAHLDPLIFVRDGLLFGALVAYVAVRIPDKSVPASVGIFAVLAVVHSVISYMNLHTTIAAIYGLKMFVPALCGFLAAGALFEPSRKVVRLVAFMWVAAFIAALLDKYWLDYPWIGVTTDLGGISVSLGRDWQSTLLERVGGLSRSSISLAVSMPLLSLILLGSLKSRALRMLIAALTLAVLVWTTQKGAIVGYALAIAALAISSRNFTAPLKAAVVLATCLLVFAPTVLIHFEMPRDQGVFSFQSLYERIEQMWPDAWKWIAKFPPYVLGVGLGGIGGGQRFFAPDDFNAADNLFVYLFGNFGIASLFYLGAIVVATLRAKLANFQRDSVVLASLAFLMMYGLVISLVEDQIAALWLGACLGWLARLNGGTRSGTAALPAGAAREPIGVRR